MQDAYQYSIDNDLISNLGVKGAEVADWMTDHGAGWVCAGAFYIPSGGLAQSILALLGIPQQARSPFAATLRDPATGPAWAIEAFAHRQQRSNRSAR